MPQKSTKRARREKRAKPKRKNQPAVPSSESQLRSPFLPTRAPAWEALSLPRCSHSSKVWIATAVATGVFAILLASQSLLRSFFPNHCLATWGHLPAVFVVPFALSSVAIFALTCLFSFTSSTTPQQTLSSPSFQPGTLRHPSQDTIRHTQDAESAANAIDLNKKSPSEQDNTYKDWDDIEDWGWDQDCTESEDEVISGDKMQSSRQEDFQTRRAWQ